MNKWIWQQIKLCFVFWGTNVITNEKLKENSRMWMRARDRRSPAPLDRVSAGSSDSFCSERESNNSKRLTKIAKQHEIYVNTFCSETQKQNTNRASQSQRTTRQMCVNVASLPSLTETLRQNTTRLDNAQTQQMENQLISWWNPCVFTCSWRQCK